MESVWEWKEGEGKVKGEGEGGRWREEKYGEMDRREDGEEGKKYLLKRW